MPTQQDIARLASVSVSTVWRVLNDPDSVDPQTCEMVQVVLKEQGYVRNALERKRQKRRRLIGLIVSDLTNPFFTMIIKGCESAARMHGYSLTISDSEDDVEIERQHLETVLDSDAAAVVFIPAANTSPAAEMAVERALPVVLVDRVVEGLEISSITTDGFEGAYQTTKYLLRLGHTDILFLCGGTGKSTADERLAGHKKALADSGLDCSRSSVIDCQYDFEKAYQGVGETLDSGTAFSAVFASADIMAFGAKRAIEERGLQIPKDISLIGYDDIQLSSSIGLTTVAQPAVEMGRNAITSLVAMIEGRLDKPARIVLQARLIIRETCRRKG